MLNFEGSGAVTPPDDPMWQHEDATTDRFLKDARKALDDPSVLAESERYVLQATIERIHDGSEGISADDTFETWLERLRDHHP